LTIALAVSCSLSELKLLISEKNTVSRTWKI
jgi:hypothetical protein